MSSGGRFPDGEPFGERQVRILFDSLGGNARRGAGRRGGGFGDVAAKKPMQTNSVFWIASQSKPITAAVR
jgi:hypothetical protein